MPLLRRSLPVFSLHRDTMLNRDLAPASRLLWAVMVASLDRDKLSIDDCLSLAGITNPDAAQRCLEQLEAAGLLETHRPEGQELTVLVNEIPAPRTETATAERVHQCVPCKDCGKCACRDGYGDRCHGCFYTEEARKEARADVARWQAQLDAGATYAYGRSGRRLHRWDCSTLNTVERGWDTLENLAASPYGGAYWPKLPDLYTAEEIRAKRPRQRCGICGPDPV